MNLSQFNSKLKVVSPKFFTLHKDHSVATTTIEMKLGALATYFVCLLESNEKDEVEQICEFIEESIKSTDTPFNKLVLNHFLLAIFELESLEIIKKNTLFSVLKPSSKALLQEHLDKKSTTLLSKSGSLSSSSRVL